MNKYATIKIYMKYENKLQLHTTTTCRKYNILQPLKLRN